MGSSKNKSAAQVQKSQNTSKKGKKNKEESSRQSRAEIIVTLTEDQVQKYLKGAKAITASDIAKQCGVKISAANTYLNTAMADGKMTIAGGHSGHRIYKLTE
ncbi:MAG: ribosomal protein S25 [Cenarchaeum symbiont of Oopsacas minuta]|nr:ribosomal protein S25 [Cenarchaeum symbiont of Oopsacas minuta]